MNFCITRQRWGLILTVIGAVALAFSLRTKKQYEGEAEKAVERAKKSNQGLFVPTETHIIRFLFWIGLVLIALGTLLQW